MCMFPVRARIRVSGTSRDDGAVPDSIGVYHDLLAENYRKEIDISEGEDYIPLDGHRCERRARRLLWLGVERRADGFCGAQRAVRRTCKSRQRRHFKTDLAAGETFEVPPGFIGAYKGDLDDAANSLHHIPVQSLDACDPEDRTPVIRKWNGTPLPRRARGREAGLPPKASIIR